MIKHINGSIILAEEDIIAHQTNAQGVMGSGLAKQIRDSFPEAYAQYKRLADSYSDKSNLLGRSQLVEVREGKYVANLFGQLNYGRSARQYTQYDALEQALITLKNKAQRAGLSVALPYLLGCGLANGDWKVVEKMIDDIFADYEVTIYKFQP